MRMNEPEIRKYLRDVADAITCPRGVKSVYMSELKSLIRDFVSEKEMISREILCSRFGTPEDISNGFLERDDYKRMLKKSRKKVTALVAALVLAFAVIAVLVWYAAVLSNAVGREITVSNPMMIINWR